MEKGRVLLAAGFVVAGTLHFLLTPAYMKIMPPYLPEPRMLVEVSGACEVLGGLGLLARSTRRPAAWGLAALLVAVMPANIYMASEAARWPMIPAWLLWARVPMQLPMIWWALRYSGANQSKL